MRENIVREIVEIWQRSAMNLKKNISCNPNTVDLDLDIESLNLGTVIVKASNYLEIIQTPNVIFNNSFLKWQVSEEI